MVFDISEYPEKSGELTELPVSEVIFSGINPSGWQTHVQKLTDLQSGTGIFTGHMFDHRQDRDFVPTTENLLANGDPGIFVQGFEGRGINRFYPSPKDYKYGNDSFAFTGQLFGTSGIIITYPPSSDTLNNHPEYTAYDGSTGRGIFNFAGLLNSFSNAKFSKDVTGAAGIDNFTIFNDYVHHLHYGEDLEDAFPVRVPFVADLIATTGIWDRYGRTLSDDEIFQQSTDPSY